MRTFPRLFFLSALSLSLGLTGCKRTHQILHHVASSEPDYTPQLQAEITSSHLDGLRAPDFKDIQPQVESLYDGRDFDLVWVANGKPTRQADAMLEEFSNAVKRGLRPEDYDASHWGEWAGNLKTPEGAAFFDVALTVDAIRFANDLHSGRVSPTYFAFGIKDYARRKLDSGNTLPSELIDGGNTAETLDKLEPQTEQYKQLKSALQHYLDLAAQDHSEPLPEMDSKAPSVALHAGYSGLPALTQKLALVGDLDNSTPPDLEKLTDALRHFQHRHGLNEDGKLGSATIDALNTPMSGRVIEIEDSMERWRWLTDEYQNAAIMVNLPEFVLRAYEGTGSGHNEVFQMKVVDGKSDDPTHNTPVIADMMKYVVFRPFWNVPPSIAKKEIIPHMKANAGYLGAKNYETVDLHGKPAPADISRIAQGTVMVRQKSGTSNSLGLVKFMFPNPFNVYLHDTNEKALFSRTRRDYSHGCVRVQDPPKLADWLLRDNPKWDADTITDAMNTGDDNKTVLLPKPVPVVIFYGTAWWDNGEMHFFRDMYGYDDEMNKVLEKGRPYPTKPVKQASEADV